MASMAQASEGAAGAIDRSERPGHLGLLLTLAAVLVAAFAAVTLVPNEQAQAVIMTLLAFLAMAGVFFVFAIAVGAVRFTSRGGRDDLTKAIVDTAADGVVVVDENGRPIYANPRYLALTGTRNAAELRPVDRLFAGGPEVGEAIYRLAQAAREGRPAVEEVRLSPALGGPARSFGWYRLTVRTLIRGGRPVTVWSIGDVTHDRERQENVFQELQHAIDYLDHAPAGFFSVDGDGQIVYMNATLANWLDHDLAKVGSGGLRLPDVMTAPAVTMLSAVAARPGDVKTETVDLDLRRRQGQPLPVRVYHRVSTGPDGRPGPSRTLVLNRSPGLDVAEGQRAAEVRFARLFNSTPLAIASLDRSRRAVRSNPSFLKLFGTRASTTSGAGAPLAELVAASDRARFEAGLADAAAGRADIAPLDIALAEGGRQARVWLSPVSDADATDGASGESVILYALDTTEQRQLEQQFAQAQKMQAIGQLAGGVAHDFNNVLQAIIGYSDLLLASHRPTDPSFQDIMQIKQNANRAASLVRQLLAFSRRQTLRPETVRLGETLSDLSLLLKRLLGERVQLDLRQGRDLWFVKADVNQLEQVIINLAVNARDAMPDGGTVAITTANVDETEARRLELPGMPAGDYVRISVADTGTGIPPELLDKIFEPFFTTKELGKGTGLGLSTVFGIVKQSGGFIYVDSTP
ncbi:MAG: PAS domain-containing protein, partial [Methylobacteriaceae bacterium]|nr:PAS domain-containing protein [Methylobacteriaceae bacterium]